MDQMKDILKAQCSAIATLGSAGILLVVYYSYIIFLYRLMRDYL